MTKETGQRGAVPRSALWLLGVALLAAGVLWFAGRRQAADLTLGGPLFPVAPDEITGFLLTHSGMQFRFDRVDSNRWTLSGAVQDYLDPQAMTALLDVLSVAGGGAILPGTEVEDRRYDFNGSEAIRLRLFRSAGEDLTLVLGTANPVSGTYYASGAGRSAAFPVAAALRERLVGLPTAVRARTLLPPFERSLVQDLRVVRSGREHRFARFDDKWWLLLPDEADPLLGLPSLVREYQALYPDRRRDDAAGRWLMASDQAIGQLIYQVSETTVRELKTPQESAARMTQWELDPPWRQVVLSGPGLNPDPGAPVPDQFTLAFGTRIAEDRVPVLRRGHVLLTDFIAVSLLDKGLDDLVELQALNETARYADRLRVQREGGVLLETARTGVADTEEGRSAWQTVLPALGETDLAESERQGMGQDLVVNLNRVEVLAVLPATQDAGVLEDRERVRLQLSWDDGVGGPQELVLETGYLAAGYLAANASRLARTPAGEAVVCLWFPATGKLLQIPSHLVVSARHMATMVQAGAR